MRSRFTELLLAATILGAVPSLAWAQPVGQQIQNMRAQQADIEGRIVDLQSRLEDASAEKTYCSAEARQEDIRRLRGLQREIAALREEYGRFKAGFIKLATTQTAGPQFDAAGIHPDERQYWTADDNALQKLRDEALAKANQVQDAPIIDCYSKKAGPVPPPVGGSSKAPEAAGQPTNMTKAPPPAQPSAPKGPTAPLGGSVTRADCTEKQRTDARLRLQEELLRLQAEFIPIDGTTSQGRARQQQVLHEIERVKAMMNSDCPPLLGPDKPLVSPRTPVLTPPHTPATTQEKPTPPKYSIVEDLREPPTKAEVNAINARIEDFRKTTRAYPHLLEGCHPDIWDKHIAQLEDLARRARQIEEDVKRGYSNGVSAKEAEQPASAAQSAVDEAKRAKEANLEQWRAPTCPRYAPVPEQPTFKPLLRPIIPQQPLKIAKDPFDQLEDDAEDALDDLDDAMDDCDEAAVKALIPKLEELSRQAHAAANAARSAGRFSNVDPKEAGAMAEDLDDAIKDAKDFKCLLRHPRGYQILPMHLSPLDQRILYIHNEERAAVHAAPLKWNFRLEWDATGYADRLAELHQLVHAPREGRGIERENLLQALPGWSPDRMMQSWTMEKRDFVAGYYPNVALDGNWLNVSHYTQMIWPTTTDIGCGYAEGGGYGWLVCRYSPGGNKDGKPVGLRNYPPERG